MKDFSQYGNRPDDQWEMLPWIPDPRPPFKIWVKPEQIAPFFVIPHHPYSMHLHHFESPEDEDKPFDMEEPNFFGVSIAYDPYMREVVKAEQFTTCGGDGGRSICGGLGIFLGFLPCSPHYKPEVQEDKELNGDYDFYRPIIRVEAI